MLAQKIDNVISEFEDSLKKEKNNRFYDSEEDHQKLIKDYEMHLNIMYLIRSSFILKNLNLFLHKIRFFTILLNAFFIEQKNSNILYN